MAVGTVSEKNMTELVQVIQRIADEDGVEIQGIGVSFEDISTMDGKSIVVKEIQLHTKNPV